MITKEETPRLYEIFRDAPTSDVVDPYIMRDITKEDVIDDLYTRIEEDLVSMMPLLFDQVQEENGLNNLCDSLCRNDDTFMDTCVNNECAVDFTNIEFINYFVERNPELNEYYNHVTKKEMIPFIQNGIHAYLSEFMAPYRIKEVFSQINDPRSVIDLCNEACENASEKKDMCIGGTCVIQNFKKDDMRYWDSEFEYELENIEYVKGSDIQKRMKQIAEEEKKIKESKSIYDDIREQAEIATKLLKKDEISLKSKQQSIDLLASFMMEESVLHVMGEMNKTFMRPSFSNLDKFTSKCIKSFEKYHKKKCKGENNNNDNICLIMNGHREEDGDFDGTGKGKDHMCRNFNLVDTSENAMDGIDNYICDKDLPYNGLCEIATDKIKFINKEPKCCDSNDIAICDKGKCQLVEKGEL